MRSLCVLLAALLVLLAALPAQASAKGCRDVIDTGPTGFDPADSDRVRAFGVRCWVARKLAANASLIAAKQRTKVRGFNCRHGGLRPDGFFRQRCRRGERLVRWVLGNAERGCPGTVFIADPGITVRYWVQGVTCARGGQVLVNSDPFPPGWRNAGKDVEGRRHVVRDRPRARIAYRK